MSIGFLFAPVERPGNEPEHVDAHDLNSSFAKAESTITGFLFQETQSPDRWSAVVSGGGGYRVRTNS
jgi:hypothetical protein